MQTWMQTFLRMESRWPCKQNKRIMRRGCRSVTTFENCSLVLKEHLFRDRTTISKIKRISPVGSRLGSVYDKLIKQIVNFVHVDKQFVVKIHH